MKTQHEILTRIFSLLDCMVLPVHGQVIPHIKHRIRQEFGFTEDKYIGFGKDEFGRVYQILQAPDGTIYLGNEAACLCRYRNGRKHYRGIRSDKKVKGWKCV